MSLTQPPSYPPPPLDMVSYHTALSPAPRPTISIPQSNLSFGQLGSPSGTTFAFSAVHSRTRPEFTRGFGLETPEEADEDAEEGKKEQSDTENDAQEDTVIDVDDSTQSPDPATATATGPQSRVHSRHASKFSGSLSVPSRIRTPLIGDVTADLDVDAAGEWTGSDDLYLSESSDNESIGEWSNPSDEERARQGRAVRRMQRRLAGQQLADKPRRIPNFPKPPEEPTLDVMARHQHRLSNPQPQSTYDRDEDIISNPSEEYLAVAAGNFYASRSPNSQSLPPLPKHSRTPSVSQYSAHDPAQAHSRTSSDTFGVQYQHQMQQQRQDQRVQPPTPASVLNPFAKPFVFGVGRPNQLTVPQQQQQQLAAPPNAPLLSHSPLPSVGSSTGACASISSLNSLNAKPLNVSAPEFKPTGFTFRPPPGVPQMPALQIPTELGLGLGLGPTADGGWGIGGSVSPGNLFSRPLPPTPSHPTGSAVAGSQTMREQQGREKRQRRNSSSGDIGNTAVFDEGDSLRSFRFPVNMESPKSLRSIRRSMSDASVHHRAMSSSDREKDRGDQEPFSYATFSTVASLPFVPLPKEINADEGEKDMELEEDAGGQVNGEVSTFTDDSTAKNETRQSIEKEEKEKQEEGTSLFRSKRRPPLPLDFRQEPTRKNTVPAGLFKALANGNNRDADERTRKTVRSRLSSRDYFDDCRKPSLDDIHMPRISGSLGRDRFITDARGGLFGRRDENEGSGDSDEGDDKKSFDDNDVFSTTRQQQQHQRRSSSLPDDLHDVEEDDADRELVESPGLELTTRVDMQDFEERLVGLIGDRFGALERVLAERHDVREGSTVLNSKTEAMIADMVSLFRAQLQENALRSLEDSQMDARGEMDFQLIKDIIDEGHKELAEMLRTEIKDTPEHQSPTEQIKDVVAHVVEDVGSRTVSAIVETIADFSTRQEAAVNRVASAPARERDALVEKLVNTLSPMLTEGHANPIDYEFLTSQLAQAVKPHISQLIDLASDKRETAGLIVDQILPLLPGQPPIDIDVLTFKLITEVRRAIAPIDAHEIKEQVADLVIERLDSRLAVRDKLLNVDTIAAKLVESVSGVVQVPVNMIQGALSKAMQEQKTEWQAQVEELSLRIAELPARLAERVDGLVDAQDKIMSKLEQPAAKVEGEESIKTIVTHVEQLVSGHKDLQSRDEELLSLNKEILDKLLSLPDVLLAASNVLSDSHSELVTSLESSRREVDELRKLSTDYQVQVAKARGAHGQVRVEKDALNEKLVSAETDRERLRAQVNELQSEKAAHTAEINALKIRNVELEEALSQALTRLQAADVSTAASQQRLINLEQANHDLSDEKHALQATVESLNMQLDYANRDKETGTQTLERLQKQNEELTLQQNHWGSLREAAEKIDALTNLIGQADNEELKELRLIRNHTKALETEYATLQKRFKEAESKVANSERAATTARQSLAQAQQRAAEWERRTKETEGQLELTRTKLEQAELTQTQLQTDLSLVRLQLEEREAEDRLTKDREAKLREQITVLEMKLEQAKTPKLPQATTAMIAPSPFRASTNGVAPRPNSRTSTVYDMRSPTPSHHLRPISQASFNSGTPPSGSVWNSMHAPRQPYPISGWSSGQLKKYPYLGPSTPREQQNAHQYYRAAAPSPTPSTVSAAPTQGEDGWWS
ncbi:hypothetical protein AX15_005753 [Amanita polypyramis BW_CC]|nr:hypothetical protein AX15_005753 [Amanita polypyramis BW_CC]